MTNKQWIDLLSKEWNVSRTCAKEMLHTLFEIQKFNRMFDTYNTKPTIYRDTDSLIIKEENEK